MPRSSHRFRAESIVRASRRPRLAVAFGYAACRQPSPSWSDHGAETPPLGWARGTEWRRREDGSDLVADGLNPTERGAPPGRSDVRPGHRADCGADRRSDTGPGGPPDLPGRLPGGD